MRGQENEKVTPLNIRVKAQQRQLIELAAKTADKSVSDFVRDAAIMEARHAILDKAHFELDKAAWEEFVIALESAPQTNARLRDLLSRKSPWEH